MVVAALAAFLVAGCGSEPPPDPGRSPGTIPGPAAPSGRGPAAPTGTPTEWVTVEVPDGLAAAPFDRPRRVQIPQGWTMSVWARTPKPRLATWAPDDTLLISVPSAGRVLRVLPDGTVTELLDGLREPHGLAFDGSELFVAQSNRVDSYTYDSTNQEGQVSPPTPVATGLPDAKSPDLRGAYAHALKSVAIGPDGAVYFSIGSTGNISAADREADPPRATIMRVPPGGGEPTAFATGVRNGTGLALAPDGSVWTAVNNRDNVADPATGRVTTGYVNEHPPESVARLTTGRELGWPYCNPDGGPADLPLIRDVQTNADGDAMDCAALEPIEQSLPAHSAPLGMTFAELPEPFGQGALVGVHGSWNRTPPQPPEVAFFPWRDGGLLDQQTLVGGFQNPDGSRWGRPVAAVPGPDGAIYITDDYADAVYRLSPPGS
ncbi:PQQ-dependent sugar dehydrogenase [Mycolicibacterium palauense]|uniref:PQQ-dependent sugar dehydrogenase n=1 Tax=Mycolicibacterium palauense TaxID=2034511 RepID=UPI000BFEBE0B